MTEQRVGVVGCGLMGSGIAEVCARAGYATTVIEAGNDLLARGLGRLEASLAKGVERGKLTAAERDAARRRLHGSTDLSEVAACDLVIEAVVENVASKQAVFSRLGSICSREAILASNTSSIPIIEFARVTSAPQRVVGMHFFNPVPVMQLVELVRPLTATDETLGRARRFVESLGKRAIVAPDRAGFLVDYLLVPYLLDAIRLVEQNFAVKEDIDAGMTLGAGYPMGPLTLADFVGLDILLHESDVLFDALKDSRFVAPTLLRHMVATGWLGRKAGRGFYDYAAGQTPPTAARGGNA